MFLIGKSGSDLNLYCVVIIMQSYVPGIVWSILINGGRDGVLVITKDCGQKRGGKEREGGREKGRKREERRGKEEERKEEERRKEREGRKEGEGGW